MSSPFLVELVAQRMYASHRSCDTTAKRDGSERDDKDGTHGITVEKCRYCVYMHSLLRKRKRACGSKHHSRRYAHTGVTLQCFDRNCGAARSSDESRCALLGPSSVGL